MTARWRATLVCGAALLGGCGGSKGRSNDGAADHPAVDVPATEGDAGTDASDDVRVSFDVVVDTGTGDAQGDARDTAAGGDARDALAADDAHDAGASSDGRDAR